MKLAVQMYSVRDLCAQDMEAALRKVSEFGYQGVEFAGFFDIDKQVMAEWLKKYNLEAMGSHTPADQIFDHTDDVIAYNKAINNNRIVCPGYSLNTKEDCVDFCEKMKKAGEILKQHGMTLYYHNHSHEFEKVDGKYIMDILAELMTPEQLGFEIDAYWVYRAGVNPVKYMKKHADRISIFHMKDGNMQDGTPVGEGEVDVDGVLNFAYQNNIQWAIVEAESGSTADQQLYDVQKSAEFLKPLIK